MDDHFLSLLKSKLISLDGHFLSLLKNKVISLDKHFDHFDASSFIHFLVVVFDILDFLRLCENPCLLTLV